MAKRFFFYGLAGWGIEIIWTGMGSLLSGDIKLTGNTSLWMFFIYGLAVFLEPIHDIIRNWRWPVRGLLWVLIIWGMEYAAGLFIKNILGFSVWEYTSGIAVDSLVRLDYGPAWFVAGLVFERFHLLLDSYGVA